MLPLPPPLPLGLGHSSSSWQLGPDGSPSCPPIQTFRRHQDPGPEICSRSRRNPHPAAGLKDVWFRHVDHLHLRRRPRALSPCPLHRTQGLAISQPSYKVPHVYHRRCGVGYWNVAVCPQHYSRLMHLFCSGNKVLGRTQPPMESRSRLSACVVSLCRCFIFKVPHHLYNDDITKNIG